MSTALGTAAELDAFRDLLHRAQKELAHICREYGSEVNDLNTLLYQELPALYGRIRTHEMESS